MKKENKEFYERILMGQETAEDLQKFEGLCSCYSDMYKDIYGFRPRNEETMCVNGYSGNPDINAFRELLKKGRNPLAELEDEYDSLIDEENTFIDDCSEIMNECEEMEFIETNPSKDELLEKHPEYEKYFA